MSEQGQLWFAHLSFLTFVCVWQRQRFFCSAHCTFPPKFKFGLSLLYALLSQGEKLLSSGVPLEPSIGDFETWCGIFRSMSWPHQATAILDYILFWLVGRTSSSRWLNSCPTARWWSRFFCPPTCSPFSVATWTSALCTSWKATWSEFLFV